MNVLGLEITKGQDEVENSKPQASDGYIPVNRYFTVESPVPRLVIN